ncbi:hypothetical protein [Shewanella surugensis]|uniref:DUF3624 domain-containing protein n=1 Tax=Shewanella surugensis TaxID=212020 RepID=A0ABT0LF27_9GAMM|nr:hypothetical protein [Shewanella surugensis]MCL1126304.1 hypothetical protein [Shewanella surugensis]
MLCTHCHKSFQISKVENQRGKGLNSQIQCPLCEAWLGRNPILSRLKMVGFYIGAFAIAACYWAPEYKNIAIPVTILSIIVLLVSHLMDHLYVTEAPVIPEINNDEHRRKYR